MKPFRLHEPTSVREAVAVLQERGDRARLYAGGTELLLAMKTGLLESDDLVNVKTIVGLDDISLDNDELVIGAAATHRNIEESPIVRKRFSQLVEVERNVANVRVRNVGTLSGNLCFAEPHSDPATLLLLLGARLEVSGADRPRHIPLSTFHVGPYETQLRPTEMVVNVRVQAPPPNAGIVYHKFGHHHRPTLGVGAMVQSQGGHVSDVRLSLGCVSPVATRLPDAEAVLMGEPVGRLHGDSAPIVEAGRLAAAAAEAVDDMHGSADYKKHLISVYVERAITNALRQTEET